MGDLSLFVADFSSLGVGDLLLFVTDFTREFRYERFDAICRLLFKRAYVWEIWCYLLPTFLENLSMMIWCYLSPTFQEFRCGRFGTICHLLSKGWVRHYWCY